MRAAFASELAVAAEHLAHDHGPGDDHRGALGLQSRQLAAFGEWKGGQPLQLRHRL